MQPVEIDTMLSMLLVIAALLAVPCSGVGQARWFVNASATGASTGTNWDDAFVDLQQALAVAQGGDEIWVAKGIYRPDGGTLDKTLSFRVPSAVAVHGGFAGDERVLSQRDLTQNSTILTGDLLDNDRPPLGMEENSLEVVRILAGEGISTLSGLTVKSGAMVPLLVIEAAGIHLEVGANALIDQCVIRDNLGDSSPGGVGLGLDFTGKATVLVSNSVFMNNSTKHASGGACWVEGTAIGKFVNCRFLGNRAAFTGGAIYGGAGTQVEVVNCAFSGNTAASAGSAIDAAGQVYVGNCTLSQNRVLAASGGGGAVSTSGSTTMTVVNCIFAENKAAGDKPAHISNVFGGILSASYCCLFPQEDPIIGTHHIFFDPLLKDSLGPDRLPGTLDDDLSIAEKSPCIDAGNTNEVGPDVADFDADGDVLEAVPVDLAACPRVIDRPNISDSGVGTPTVDMGACEVSNWSNLGHGLEGSHGVPWLIGNGDWFSDYLVSVQLSNARESSLAALLLGDSVVLAPFKGGVLVPSPLLAFLIRTGPNGEFSLSDRVPPIAVPATVALQVWIADPEAPEGASATAGFTGTLNQ